MELGVDEQQQQEQQQQRTARALATSLLGITTAASACASKPSGQCRGDTAD
jgi:hypothetical protein